MLQAEEKIVKKVQNKNLEQELKQKKPGEILLIYDDDCYMGYLGWEKECWNRAENIVTEFIKNKTDKDDIETTCENILRKKPIIKVPVFLKNGGVDKIYLVGKIFGLTNFEHDLLISIRSLKETKSVRLEKQLSKYRGVLLLHTGWIANQLEGLFLRYGLNVLREKTEVVDEDWLILDESKMEHEIFLQNIFREARMENTNTYLKIKSRLEKKGIPVLLIAFPSNSDFELTKEERYREERKISFGRAEEILKEGTLAEQRELMKVYQKVISVEDVKKATFMKLSQEEENILYLYGPCIVGGNAPKGDRFPEVLYQEVLCKLGYKIEKIAISECDSTNGNKIFSKEFRKNDVLVIAKVMSKDLRERFKSYVDIDLTDFFQKRSTETPWFSDNVMHITGEGSRQLVKYLCPILVQWLSQVKNGGGSGEEYKQIKKLDLNHLERKELETYFKKIEPQCFEKSFSKK